MYELLRIAASTVAIGVVASVPVSGQVLIGPEVDFANDFDLGIGGRIIVPLEDVHPNVSAEGSFVYFFPSESVQGVPGVSADVGYWEVNGNVRLAIPVDNPSVSPYVGTGLNVGHVSGTVQIEGVGDTSSDATEIGLNLLGGVQFGTGSTRPFAEARLQVGGGEQFMIAGGVTIPVGS